MSAADALALLRALAAIPIAWAILTDEPAIAFVLFALAAVSDAIDGWLARRAGTLGPRGAFLDPLADKILVVASLVALALVGAIDEIIVAAVALREVVVLILRARAYASATRLVTGVPAKAKTAAEMIGIGLLIAARPPLSSAGAVLIVLALVVGLLTLPHYFPGRTRRLA